MTVKAAGRVHGCLAEPAYGVGLRYAVVDMGTEWEEVLSNGKSQKRLEPAKVLSNSTRGGGEERETSLF